MSDSNKPHIVLASCHPSSKGGISTWVRSLQSQVSSDERVTVECIYPAYRGENDVVADKRTVFNRIFIGISVMLKCFCKFKKLVQKNKPNVLHVTTSGSLAILRDILFLRAAKRMGIATIYHIHFGRIPECYRKNNCEWKFIRFALRYADCVIVIDRETERVLRLSCPNSRILHIPNFINLASICEINAQDNDHSLVFIGWCVKSKGIEELLCAWDRIRKKYSDFTLKIVGPYSEDYINFLRKNFCFKNVLLFGEKDHEEALRILSAADVFVLPSHTEGFPYVVLEAMAMGKPIVATNVGAIPDILKDCGLVVKCKDVDLLCAAMDKLLSDSEMRRALGRSAKEKLDNNFTADRVYEQYVSAWKQLVR